MTNQLIPVFTGLINKEEINLVNARELHQFLDVTSRFNDWIANRINEYKFTENLDYISFTKKLVKPNGGRPSTEYHLSLDMAKELAMVERTEKGRQARKYFIECERKLKAILSNSPSAIEELPPQIETIKFYGQDIDVIFYNNQPYIIVKQISDNIGLHTESQRIQVQKNKSLNKTTCMINLPTNGGNQRHLCLPLSMLNAWLQKLVPSHTKANKMLNVYQTECFNYLFNHFSSKDYQKTTYTLPNTTGTEPSYEKLTPAQTRELTKKIHELSNQFGCNRIANSAIWYAMRHVTGTPSPDPFDVRHLPLIVKEYNRIKSVVTQYKENIQLNERKIITKIIRKREPIEDVLKNTNNSINSILKLSDKKLVEQLKPCDLLSTTDILS